MKQARCRRAPQTLLLLLLADCCRVCLSSFAARQDTLQTLGDVALAAEALRTLQQKCKSLRTRALDELLAQADNKTAYFEGVKTLFENQPEVPKLPGPLPPALFIGDSIVRLVCAHKGPPPET